MKTNLETFIETHTEVLTELYNQFIELLTEAEMSFHEFCFEIFVELPE